METSTSIQKAVSSGHYFINSDKFNISKTLLKESIEESKIIQNASVLSNFVSNRILEHPSITFVKGDTLDGLRFLLKTSSLSSEHTKQYRKMNRKEPAVLVFASDTNPGGSKKSSNLGTQEEALCRTSTLRLAQITLNYPIPLDGIAYVPHVQALIEPPLDDDSRDAAPTFTALCGALRQCIAGSIPTHKEIAFVEHKICGILDQAAMNGHVDLVLGAWGCGAFGNPIECVAASFWNCLHMDKYNGCFHHIVFAIPSSQIETFQHFFNNAGMSGKIDDSSKKLFSKAEKKKKLLKDTEDLLNAGLKSISKKSEKKKK